MVCSISVDVSSLSYSDASILHSSVNNGPEICSWTLQFDTFSSDFYLQSKQASNKSALGYIGRIGRSEYKYNVEQRGSCPKQYRLTTDEVLLAAALAHVRKHIFSSSPFVGLILLFSNTYHF